MTSAAPTVPLVLESDRLFPSLSRADVAEFMLGQLTDTPYLRQAVSVFPCLR